MITPRFSLSQDSNSVTIVIRAPYCSLRELDISVEEHVFIFSCQPYYLRLHLPGQIEENDNARSSFDANTGEFMFCYEKVNADEDFPNLEFITKLLCPKIEVGDGNRKIEVVGSTHADASVESPEGGMEYGFAMRGGYNFKTLTKEFSNVFDADPLEVKLEERSLRRRQMEQDQFDAEHYIADLMENDEINELLQLRTPWETFTRANLEFTPDELDFLKDLPNVTYDLNEQQVRYCHNSLIEILYAYCYDRRTTCFEATCESGWTISKISASLCWFDGFLNPKEALICAFRRSLIYPLYRDFNLCQQILTDLKSVIKLGEQFIIKCLIDIYNIFLTGDSGRYILNNLFIKDYIVYVMKWEKNSWSKTVQELNNSVIEKKDLGLDLQQIEQSLTSDDLTNTMANLSIGEQDFSTDSDDLSSSSSESESCDESETSSEDGSETQR